MLLTCQKCNEKKCKIDSNPIIKILIPIINITSYVFFFFSGENKQTSQSRNNGMSDNAMSAFLGNI